MQPGFRGLADKLVEAFARDDATSDGKQIEATNLRCLAAFYAGLAAGDYEVAMTQLDPQSSYAMYSGGPTPFRMAGRGRAEVEEGIRRNYGVMTFDRVDIETLVAQGDLVMIVLRQRGHWRHNGEEFDERGLLEYRFNGGRIHSYRCFVLPFAP